MLLLMGDIFNVLACSISSQYAAAHRVIRDIFDV